MVLRLVGGVFSNNKSGGITWFCSIHSKEKRMEEERIEDYLYESKDGDQFGIFKLTPRECGRLMDVSDEDITKMLEVNSKSQCYKQFGNSIVVNVLVAIFGQLFEGKEDVYRD